MPRKKTVKKKAEENVEEAEAEKPVEAEKVEERELEEGIVEERIYTIPLRRAWIAPVKKRSPRAVRLIKTFVRKHMKPEVLAIDSTVNEEVWRRGIENPPRKIKVRAAKDKDGVVTVFLAKEE